jgi:hypothetical protein
MIKSLNITVSEKKTKIDNLENEKLELENDHQLKISHIQSTLETLKKDRAQELLDFNE